MSKPKVSFDIRRVEARDSDGRSVMRDADFIIFRQAGDNKTVVEKEITKEEIESWAEQPHKNHVPALYEAWKDGVEAPVDGTPLKEWTIITAPQLYKANSLGIMTVEDFATLAEDGLNEFGPGAQLLKQKAKNWLDSKNGTGMMVEKLTAQDVTLKQMQDALDKQAKIIEELTKKKGKAEDKD